ncbi:hypothetical protein BJ741DRAFT_233577 [Chytriomyces cf. hyalinus JEL632]|nr:hypothetical protein BJ741DRAFT_233577 [Chytriomyces cf. hyalinus JEL632]
MLACILLTVLLWSHPIAAQSGNPTLAIVSVSKLTLTNIQAHAHSDCGNAMRRATNFLFAKTVDGSPSQPVRLGRSAVSTAPPCLAASVAEMLLCPPRTRNGSAVLVTQQVQHQNYPPPEPSQVCFQLEMSLSQPHPCVPLRSKKQNSGPKLQNIYKFPHHTNAS